MARYALGFEAKRQSPELSAPRGTSWPVSFLIKSLVWFQHVRFAFAALFALFGVSGLLWQEYLEGIGLHVDPVWSLWTASVVCGLNLFFLYLTHRVRASDSAVFARGALWAQILADIVVLTVAVHFFGCTDSFVSFAYLFHIALSSIFFSRMRSFFVTILACTLFVGCVVAEKCEAIVTRSVFIHGAIRNGDAETVVAINGHTRHEGVGSVGCGDGDGRARRSGDQGPGVGKRAELGIVGKPAILIPFPFAADNHQELNAAELAESGAAVLARQSELTAEKLAELIDSRIGDPDLLSRMGSAMKGHGKPEAAAQVASWCAAQTS